MSSTQVGFDPYDQWLGIPPTERPPDHYRLLGLARYEGDSARIEAAADERMRLVCKHLTGPHAALTQPLLAELAAARECLLSPQAKSEYDDRLRSGSASAAPLARVIAVPTAAAFPPPVAMPVAATVPPPPAPAMAASPPAANQSAGALKAEETDVGEIPPASGRSFVLTFLGMAAAVVLVALATYGIGRQIWSATHVADRPAEKAPADVDQPQEVNPGEHPAGEKPERSRQQAKKAVVVMQEGSQDVNLTPATAILTGNVKLKPIGGDELLDNWSQEGDQAQWTFKLLRPGFFRMDLTYAALDEAGETTITALLDEAELETLTLRPTGNLEMWRAEQNTIPITTGGEHTLAVRLDSPVAAGSLVLKGVRLAPVTSASDEKK